MTRCAVQRVTAVTSPSTRAARCSATSARASARWSARRVTHDVDVLLGDADIVVESFGPGNFDVDGVRARHPHLVVLSISPFGAGGPLSDRAATDFTVQAESGTLLFRGKTSREPVQAGGRLAEYVGGLYGAPAVVVAAAACAPHGRGRAHRPVPHRGDGHRGVDVRRPRQPLHRPARPGHARRAASRRRRSSGRATASSASTPTPPPMLQNFLVLIERTDLLDDSAVRGPRRALHEHGRVAGDRRRLHAASPRSRRSSRPRPRCGSRCRRCYDGETILSNEHVVARGVFLDGPDGLPRPRRPYRLDGDPLPAPQASPRLGEHDGAIEARPRPAPTEPDADPTALPLAGLKVLDVTSWWVGAAATHFLALMGAEVIHVESITHPDGMRLTGAGFGAPDWWEWGHMFAAANTDKLDITIDVGTDEGRDLMVRLIEWADVLAENFAPRVMENWRLDHDDVLAINPNIVYLRMPGMGLAGPWRDRVGVRADDGADERAGVDHRLPRRHPAHPPRPRRSHRRVARRVRDPHRAHAAGPHRQGRRDRGADDRGGDQRHRGTGARVRRVPGTR